MQRSSIHDNAICTAQWQTLIYIYVHGKPLCCDVPPRIAKDPTAAQLWLWIMKSCKDPHGVQNRLYNASHIKTGVAAPAAHTHTQTRYLSSPALFPWREKTTMFRAPASSPTQVPCKSRAAIPMCILRSTSPMQQPCCQTNAICNRALQNTNRGTNHMPKQPFVAGSSQSTR